MQPPRIVIILPEEWPRALLRVELRERGYDAVGAQGLEEAAAYASQNDQRGPVRLIVIDQTIVEAAEAGSLELLKHTLGTGTMLLLGRPGAKSPTGAWARVIGRPFHVGDVLRAVEEILPLATRTYVPIDAPSAAPEQTLGPP